MDAWILLPHPPCWVAGGVLAAIDGQAALLIGAALPPVCVRVHALVPLSANSCAIDVGVADEVITIDPLAALLVRATLDLFEAFLCLPLSGGVASLCQAEPLVTALLVRVSPTVQVRLAMLVRLVHPLRLVAALPRCAEFLLAALLIGTAKEGLPGLLLQGLLAAGVGGAHLRLAALLDGAAYNGCRVGLPLRVVWALECVALLHIAALVPGVAQNVGSSGLQTIVLLRLTVEALAIDTGATLFVGAAQSSRSILEEVGQLCHQLLVGAAVRGALLRLAALLLGAAQDHVTFVYPLGHVLAEVLGAVLRRATGGVVMAALRAEVDRLVIHAGGRADTLDLRALLEHAAAGGGEAEQAFPAFLHGWGWAVKVVAGPWCQANVGNDDLPGGPNGRLLVLKLNLATRDVDLVSDLDVLLLTSSWNSDIQEATISTATGEAESAIDLAVGGEGRLQYPRHADLPLRIFLQGGTQLIQVPDRVHWVHRCATVLIVDQRHRLWQSVRIPIGHSWRTWIRVFFELLKLGVRLTEARPNLRRVNQQGRAQRHED
mmetsp:Transcript_12902/g.24329  ORF Transcript_12902/g.24329 Transcript_12902/m.24329 type:complete len:546 (-) Transcript_12902:43-1680(-)